MSQVYQVPAAPLNRDPTAGELSDRYAEELLGRPAQADLERAVRKMLGVPDVRKVGTLLESLGEQPRNLRPPPETGSLEDALRILQGIMDARRGR